MSAGVHRECELCWLWICPNMEAHPVGWRICPCCSPVAGGCEHQQALGRATPLKPDQERELVALRRRCFGHE